MFGTERWTHDQAALTRKKRTFCSTKASGAWNTIQILLVFFCKWTQTHALLIDAYLLSYFCGCRQCRQFEIFGEPIINNEGHKITIFNEYTRLFPVEIPAWPPNSSNTRIHPCLHISSSKTPHPHPPIFALGISKKAVYGMVWILSGITQYVMARCVTCLFQ